jgi:hypothetical protein
VKRWSLIFFVDNALILNAEEQSGGGGRRWVSVASLERILSRDEES